MVHSEHDFEHLAPVAVLAVERGRQPQSDVDAALSRPDAAEAAARVADAALAAGVRLAHVELRDDSVAASGTAPDAAAAHRFAETLRTEGLRAALAEAPKPSGNGGAVSFFVQPSGEDAR